MSYRRGVVFDPFHQLRSEFDRQVGGVWDNLAAVGPRFVAGRVFPAVNVWEEGGTFYAEAEIPGVKSEDLEISVVGNELTIKGQRPEPAADSAFHRVERRSGSFTRVMRLPVEIDAANVDAQLRDGVLLVKLPRHKNATPRKISVNAVA
jgi:HSP20 family protein